MVLRRSPGHRVAARPTGRASDRQPIMSTYHYYNDSDPKICAWVRELIAAKLVPDGEVDGRSIADVSAGDVRHFTQCHFFCGILGWPLALALAGVAGDTRLWTGSCPCQPFSVAGRNGGTGDDRHLWPVWHELIRQCNPPLIFGEQVSSSAVVGSVAKRKAGAAPSGTAGPVWLDGIRDDLEASGYAVGACVLAASSVGAPHIRQRLYWVAVGDHATARLAHANSHRTQRPGTEEQVADAGCEADRLADAQHPQRRPDSSRHVGDRHDSGWPQAHRVAGACGEVCGDGATGRMADTQRDAAQPGRPPERPGSGVEATQPRPPVEPRRCGDVSGTGGDARRLGHPHHPRPQGRRIDPGQHADQLTAWSSSIPIRCLDGRYRRVPANATGEPEPGLQPLAHGVPSRVVRLRGYGNAIVPPLAAEFILAAMEAIDDTSAATTSMPPSTTHP